MLSVDHLVCFVEHNLKAVLNNMGWKLHLLRRAWAITVWIVTQTVVDNLVTSPSIANYRHTRELKSATGFVPNTTVLRNLPLTLLSHSL